MRRLLCLAPALLLAACGATTHLAIVKPPPEKLICADEPGRPVGTGPSYVDSSGVTRNAITDQDDAGYKGDLRNAGQDCRDKVDWLRDFFARLKG